MLRTLFSQREMTNDEWAAAQAEWRSPSNWHFGFYYAPRDPHVLVRKRRAEFGWTLNMAHRASWFWLAALLGTVLGLTLLPRLFD